MNVVFNGHPGRFYRCLKHGTDIDVKSEIGKSGCNHLDAAIMTVLSHFGYQHPRPSALFFQKVVRAFSDGGNDFTVSKFGGIYA